MKRALLILCFTGLLSASTPMELLVSPQEWVIAPTATQQLSPIIDNTDGTTSAATGVTYTSNTTSVCAVNSSGLVTGVAYGLCQITTTATNGSSYTRTRYGYVSSTNVIPHLNADQTIHTAPASGDLWLTCDFQDSFNNGIADIFKTIAQFLVPSQQAGFNCVEGGLTTGWPGPTTTEATFDASVNSLISKYSSSLAQYNMWWHAIITSYVSGCGGSTGPNCGTGSSALYTGTRGQCSTYTTNGACWQYATQQWMAARLMGLSGPDESNNNVYYPSFGTGVIGTTGAPTQISCVTSSPTTWNVTWPSPGPNLGGPGGFAIFGATTNAGLNSTIGGGFYQATGIVAGTGFAFTGPSCAGGNVTVTSSSDPGLSVQIFAWEWDANNTDYVHNTDYATIPTLVHAAGGIITGPVQSAASAVSQAGWMGACPSPPQWSDYAEVYTSQINTAFLHPTHGWTSELRNNQGQEEGFNMRRFWGNFCSPRALVLGNAAGLPLDYGLQGATVAVTSIAGPLVTFAAPHNIHTVYTSISHATISGSGNAYFNANVYIDSCPTSLTCNISLKTPSSSPGTSTAGTVTFQDMANFSQVEMNTANGQLSCAGGGTCNGPNINLKSGQTFTFACTGCSSYFTTNTFILHGWPIPGTPVSGSGGGNPQNTSQMYWSEVPPSSETSSTASSILYPDLAYRRGVNHNAGEVYTGFGYSAASICYAGTLGASGIRYYNIGQEYTWNALATSSVIWGDPNNYTIQAGNSPYYPNGESQGVETFWAQANCDLTMQRLASTGYLYQARAGAPDIGYNIEASMRSGPKGNLLLASNMQNGAQTRTVDLSACEVSGQAIARYTVTWDKIILATLSAGTMSDTPTFPDSGTIIYVCPNNAAAEVATLTLGMRLADVTGATSGGYQWSYTPQFTFASRFAPQAQYTDCSSGSCTLPVDLKIGKIYAVPVFFNSSGAPIAYPKGATMTY